MLRYETQEEPFIEGLYVCKVIQENCVLLSEALVGEKWYSAVTGMAYKHKVIGWIGPIERGERYARV